MRRRFASALLACLALGFDASLAAVLPSSSAATQTEPPVARSAIGDTTELGSDDRIRSRIQGIFGAVPALAGVRVAVRQGVVQLSGTVPSAADVARAEEIAARVQGVVTVENDVQRDLSVDETVASLGGVSKRVSDVVAALPLAGLALMIALVIAALGYALASLGWIWRRVAPNPFLADLIASAIRFVFVLTGIVIALEMLGAGALIGAVLGGAGVLGIALGFAMRDTIENYVASIMLSLRQPFRANDWVVIDTFEGRVIRLTSRATILMTLDGNHLRIPNSTVFKAVILNYTRNPQRRFDFDLGIDAEDDANAARALGTKVLQGLDFVLNEPPPSARVEQVGDSNIVIKFLAWIDQRESGWHRSRSIAIPAVKSALEEAGFALPEPIYRLRFDAGAPLPFHSIAEAGDAPKPKRTDLSLMVQEEEAHGAQAPEAVIAEMVQRERQAAESRDKDLLDSRRPVE